MSTWLAVWWYEHRRIRLAMRAMFYVHLGCLLALATAPAASASTGAAVIAWTGLHDDDNVPLASYFVSIVDTAEAATNNGQGIGWDPSSWGKWLDSALDVSLSHDMVAFFLTNEASGVIFLLGLSLSVLRFALGGKWLVEMAKLGQPLFDGIHYLAWEMKLGPIAVTAATAVAGYHYFRDRPARAWALVGTAAIFMLLIWVLFTDPVNDLVSDHGMLGMMRRTGFAIAQDIHIGVHTVSGSIEDQVDSMASHMVTVTARPMIQLMNFNMVVDGTGGCRQAWSEAIKAADGSGAGPAHAMGSFSSGGCGATQALAHAQQIGSNDIALGFVFDVTSFMISGFIWFVSISTFLVGTKALFFAIVVCPALLVGMVGWVRAKNYAINTVGQLVMHGVQMMIFTVCLALGITGLDMILITDKFGTNSIMVVPKLLLACVASVIGIVMFHWIDKHWYTHSWGTITNTISGVWQSARTSVADEWDDLAGHYRSTVGGVRRAAAYVDSRIPGYDDERRSSSGDTSGENSGEGSPPEFAVVKPRPAAKTHRARGVIQVEKKSTRVGQVMSTATKIAKVAEVAGVVVEPEALPVVATAAVVNHVRHRHDNDGSAKKSGHSPRNDNTGSNEGNGSSPRYPDRGPSRPVEQAPPAELSGVIARRGGAGKTRLPQPDPGQGSSQESGDRQRRSHVSDMKGSESSPEPTEVGSSIRSRGAR